MGSSPGNGTGSDPDVRPPGKLYRSVFLVESRNLCGYGLLVSLLSFPVVSCRGIRGVYCLNLPTA